MKNKIQQGGISTSVFDAKALAKLQEQIYSALYYYKYSVDKLELSEATQEVLVNKVLPHYNTYDASKGTFSTWLYRVVRNWMIDTFRSNQSKFRKSTLLSSFMRDDEPKIENAIHQHNPDLNLQDNDDDYDHHLLKIVLHSTIDSLPPQYSVLINLRYFQELSYQEIADKQKLPLGTVKAQLFRAKGVLFEILRKSQTLHELEISKQQRVKRVPAKEKK